jgi:hypothetical protein
LKRNKKKEEGKHRGHRERRGKPERGILRRVVEAAPCSALQFPSRRISGFGQAFDSLLGGLAPRWRGLEVVCKLRGLIPPYV